MVGDNRLVKWATKLGDRITGTEIRYFEGNEIDDAWEWVEQNE
ncbi:SpoIIAA family protein [Salinigranum salinum]